MTDRPTPPQHLVTFVADDELPPGQDWMMIQVDGDIYCVIRRTRVCPEVLEEAWAGYRKLTDETRVGLDANEREVLARTLHRIHAHLEGERATG
jgi:hypothetical protein